MSGSCKPGIPALAAGILFFVAGAACTGQMELALDLFEEQAWNGCRRECKRVLLVSPSNHTARLLHSVTGLRLRRKADEALACLQKLVDSEAPLEIRAMAAYEHGRAEWEKKRYAKAFESLQFVFLNTVETGLFLRSACSLFLIMGDKPELRKNADDLAMQINSSRDLWYGRLFSECRVAAGKEKGRALAKPGKWIVAFYRSQIAPAIAQRCSIDPSCSEYFRQACDKRGLLGFPMQADRFFREPGLVASGRNPVSVENTVKYSDPLSDHDFWMTPAPQEIDGSRK